METMKPVVMRPCVPGEFEELLHFLDQAFGKQPERWFARHKAHIFQPTPQSIARHRLVRDDRGIAGVIGIYPFQLRIGSARLRVGGVGSVAVRADLRKQGLMSSMLQDTVRTLETEGYDISWLTGNRFRYGNYGWELGGHTMRFSVELQDVARRYPAVRPLSPRKTRVADIPLLVRLYRRLGAGVIRSAEMWRVHLKKEGYGWEMATSSAGAAYVVHESAHPERIVEAGGDPDVIVALLLGHGRKWKCSSLRVDTPCWSGPLKERLFTMAAGFCLVHCGQLRIVNVARTWEKLVAQVEQRGRSQGVDDADERLDTVASAAARRLLLNRSLGYFSDTPALPARLRSFGWVRPFGWWLSPVDGV